MGWLRNLLVFPDSVWEATASRLGGEYVQGTWLANSEIRCVHRSIGVTLGVYASSDSEQHTQETRAVPNVELRPDIKLYLYPELKGILGSLTSGLLATTGKGIHISQLGGDYQVLGENPEMAERLFGASTFISTLKGMSVQPTVAVGGQLNTWANEEPEENDAQVYVSVPNVLKDVHQLSDVISLTKVLVDLLEENNCLE